MALKQIIYSSRPFGYDTAILSNILLDARRLNARDGITGALICRQDIYLQLLEGPADAVDATLARIKRDDRHLEVTMRSEAAPLHRMFGNWDMLHDPETSWLWSYEELHAGALESASTDDIRNIFSTLARKAISSVA